MVTYQPTWELLPFLHTSRYGKFALNLYTERRKLLVCFTSLFLKTILYSTCTFLYDAYISIKNSSPSSPCLHTLNNVVIVEETWTVSRDSTQQINVRICYMYTGLLICISFHVKACSVSKNETYFKRAKLYVLSKRHWIPFAITKKIFVRILCWLPNYESLDYFCKKYGISEDFWEQPIEVVTWSSCREEGWISITSEGRMVLCSSIAGSANFDAQTSCIFTAVLKSGMAIFNARVYH